MFPAIRPTAPVVAILLLSLSSPALPAQDLPPFSVEVERALQQVAKHSPVVKLLEALKGSGARMFEEQVRINEIPAPPYKERARAEYYLQKMREAGLADAYIDKEGNVVGVRRGSGTGPRLVVSAHLDTVFPEATDVKVKEKAGRFYAPGIYDDALGLTNLLTTLELFT